MKTKPFISIIVLNYFGEKVLPLMIQSVLNTTYPKDLYEIIIVDNDSKDSSKKIIEKLSKQNSNIKHLFLNENVGFAAGNSLGFERAQGKYIVLLNNDCIIEPQFLEAIIQQPEKNKKIFSVNAKILLYSKFLELSYSLPHNAVESQVSLIKSPLLRFSGKNALPLKAISQTLHETLHIPVDPVLDSGTTITISFSYSHNSDIQKNHLKILSKLPSNTTISFKNDTKKHFAEYTITIPPINRKSKYLFSKIQNAGSVVFNDGYGRDRGACVRYHTQDYEIDLGQYDRPEEVFTTCGAASLYRADVLRTFGFFDKNIFMYYEDTEISERARRMGYINVYEPQAVARHLHALSSKEWSDFFIFHAELGRLIHMYLHWPIKQVFKQTILFSTLAASRYLRDCIRNKTLKASFVYIHIVVRLLQKSPKLIIERISFNKIAKYSQNYLYNSIIRGTWQIKKY